MITTPTVFILGAGASMPYKFPSGQMLVNEICANPGAVAHDALGVHPDHYKEFADQLRQSQQPSIDAFLEYRTEFQDIGKRAIAYFLIKKENHAHLSGDWYAYLMDRLTRETSFKEFIKNQVAFITFNYDRSLEQFLFTTLCARYGKTDAEVAALVNQVKIVHVHGTLGSLPWQSADKSRPYSTSTTEQFVRMAANGIKIVGEDSSVEFEAARGLMQGAERIALLGFGYHSVNMRRLEPPLNKRVFGTCYESTPEERTFLCQKYNGLSLVDPGHTCLGFFRNCGAFLAD
jgi:hypothetical protein